jgi:hypothetical protein
VPLPLPLGLPVIVSQAPELVAVHAQPVAAVTPTVPVVEAELAERDCVDKLYEQFGGGGGGVVPNTNWFEMALCDDPPGPIAATRASYTTPATGHAPSSAAKLKRILPSL